MAGIPVTTGVGYRKGLLSAYATPQEMAVTPDMSGLGYMYGAGQGKMVAESAKMAAEEAAREGTLATAKARTAEIAREGDLELDVMRDRLDTMKSQSNIATLLGIGGVAVTGLSGLVANAQAEKRAETADKIMNLQKEATEARKAAIVTEGARNKTLFDTLMNNVRAIRTGKGVYGIW